MRQCSVAMLTKHHQPILSSAFRQDVLIPNASYLTSFSTVFTARRHASAVYVVVVSVCLSVTSRCSTETAKRRITQTTPQDLGKTQAGSPQRRRQMHVGLTGDFRQITRYNPKTLTVASVVDLIRSQVYHAEHPPLFAARLLGCSESRGFVSDS